MVNRKSSSKESRGYSKDKNAHEDNSIHEDKDKALEYNSENGRFKSFEHRFKPIFPDKKKDPLEEKTELEENIGKQVDGKSEDISKKIGDVSTESKATSLGVDIDNRLKASSLLLAMEEKELLEKGVTAKDVEEEFVEKDSKGKSAKEKLAELKNTLHMLCSEDKAFVLPNNVRLHSIMELLEYLPGMSEDVFNHHTKQGRHDFANWIKGVFDEKELAKLVEKCDTIESLIGTLREYFKL